MSKLYENVNKLKFPVSNNIRVQTILELFSEWPKRKPPRNYSIIRWRRKATDLTVSPMDSTSQKHLKKWNKAHQKQYRNGYAVPSFHWRRIWLVISSPSVTVQSEKISEETNTYAQYISLVPVLFTTRGKAWREVEKWWLVTLKETNAMKSIWLI